MENNPIEIVPLEISPKFQELIDYNKKVQDEFNEMFYQLITKPVQQEHEQRNQPK